MMVKNLDMSYLEDSFDLGIGMVHQHFKLVDILTAAENIILGLPGKQILNMKQVNKEILELAAKYGFEIDPKKKIYQMSVSEKQTVEIVISQKRSPIWTWQISVPLVCAWHLYRKTVWVWDWWVPWI